MNNKKLTKWVKFIQKQIICCRRQIDKTAKFALRTKITPNTIGSAIIIVPSRHLEIKFNC